jgi:inhibitor of cysteine peptidase
VGVELTETDSGTERAVPVGEELEVRLDENRTTGFRWRLADLPEGVALVDEGYESPSPGRPGQGGTRCFRLRPTAAGEHVVAATLGRSWESGPGARSVEFHLRAG